MTIYIHNWRIRIWTFRKFMRKIDRVPGLGQHIFEEGYPQLAKEVGEDNAYSVFWQHEYERLHFHEGMFGCYLLADYGIDMDGDYRTIVTMKSVDRHK